MDPGLVPSKVVEGAEYVSLLARKRVPYLRRTVITSIEGESRVERVAVSRVDGSGSVMPGTEKQYDDIDLVGLGWGFVPQAELVVQLHADMRHDIDGSLVAVADGNQRSSVKGLYLAGEITGVAGAMAAVVEGRIAARRAVSEALQSDVRQSLGDMKDRLQRSHHRAFSRAMQRAHPLPEKWQEWLKSETMVCRCEEVPWRQVREAAETLFADEPRGLKGTTRTGMGWCQGRMCGQAALCLSDSHSDEAPVNRRNPSIPVRLGDLASERDVL